LLFAVAEDGDSAADKGEELISVVGLLAATAPFNAIN